MIFSLQMKPDDSDPSAVLRSAVNDTRNGSYDQALTKFLWFHKHAVERDPGLSAVRLSFALGYWLQLAESYAPAQVAFVRTRDETVAAFQLDPGNFELFHDVAAFNKELGEEYRTAHLFMEVAKQDHSIAERLYHVAEPALIAQQRYDACNPFLVPERRVELATHSYNSMKRFEESRPQRNIPIPKFARIHFIKDVATLVALLILNGRNAEARSVSVSALLTLNDNEFREILEKAMNGQFPEQNES